MNIKYLFVYKRYLIINEKKNLSKNFLYEDATASAGNSIFFPLFYYFTFLRI